MIIRIIKAALFFIIFLIPENNFCMIPLFSKRYQKKVRFIKKRFKLDFGDQQKGFNWKSTDSSWQKTSKKETPGDNWWQNIKNVFTRFMKKFRRLNRPKKMTVALTAITTAYGIYRLADGFYNNKYNFPPTAHAEEKYDSQKIPVNAQDLLKDPAHFLYYILKLQKEFEAELDFKYYLEHGIENPEAFIKKFNELVEKYKKESSIFLLGECTAVEKNGEILHACELSRFESTKRSTYEDYFVHEALKKLKLQESVTVADIGSGGLYQDLVMITKLLEKKPDAHVIFNCIDGQYRAYIAVRDFIGNGKLTKTVIRELAEKIIKEEKIQQPIAFLETILIINYTEFAARIKQFNGWFIKNFPKAKIELKMYDNIGNYRLNAEKKSLWPDITSAADIDDVESIEHGSIEHWNDLITFVSQSNKNSVHIFLDRQGVYNFSATAFLQAVEAKNED